LVLLVLEFLDPIGESRRAIRLAMPDTPHGSHASAVVPRTRNAGRLPLERAPYSSKTKNRTNCGSKGGMK